MFCKTELFIESFSTKTNSAYVNRKKLALSFPFEHKFNPFLCHPIAADNGRQEGFHRFNKELLLSCYSTFSNTSSAISDAKGPGFSHNQKSTFLTKT